MKRNRILYALTMLAVLAAPAFALAQSSPSEELQQQKKFETSTGIVDSYSNPNLVITDGAGQKMTFRVDAQTMLPEALQKGQSVRIDWKKGESGEKLAVAVTIVDKPTGL